MTNLGEGCGSGANDGERLLLSRKPRYISGFRVFVEIFSITAFTSFLTTSISGRSGLRRLRAAEGAS
jgi:hypothetical protein